MILSVRRFVIATACVWSLVCAAADAATLPPGFTERLVVSGLTNPTAMAFAPDGRLFVCLQAGQIRVIKDGALLHDPFLTLTVDSLGERGVLGIAFDPAFNSNQHVYIYYTATSPDIHNRVSRFTANGDVVAPGSELVLIDLNVEPLSGASNHNGGAIHFGLDGKLYVAIGDNGVGANSQSLNTRLGKVLRLNADGTIPSDNPFFGTATGLNRAIWALGLRNPFTFAVQPGSGRIFINDVGQSAWEEINDGVAGANFGWPNCEGPNTINTETPCSSSFAAPLFAYDRRMTSECAIAGGAFYNPPVEQFPAADVGAYFFADLCGGWIRRRDPMSGIVTDFATGLSATVDLKVSSDGSLYYLSRTGVVFRINYATPGTATPGALHDFDGNGSDDLSLYAPETGTWRVRGQFEVHFGDPDDIPVPGDYNGDGTTDIAVYRPSTGQWFVRDAVHGAVRRPRRHSRCRGTTTATARPTSRSTGRRPGSGSCGTSLPSSSAVPATARCPATTTATATPTWRCTSRGPARGSCATSSPSSSATPATGRFPPTTTTTGRRTSRCIAGRPASGSCATSSRCSSATPATSPCRATTTATTRPTWRSTVHRPASGSCGTSLPRSSGTPATCPCRAWRHCCLQLRATTTVTERPTSPSIVLRRASGSSGGSSR